MATAGEYIVKIKVETDKKASKKYEQQQLKQAKSLYTKEFAVREKMALNAGKKVSSNYNKGVIDSAKRDSKRSINPLIPFWGGLETSRVAGAAKVIPIFEKRKTASPLEKRKDERYMRARAKEARKEAVSRGFAHPTMMMRGGSFLTSGMAKIGLAGIAGAGLYKALLGGNSSKGQQLITKALQRSKIANIAKSIRVSPLQLQSFDAIYGAGAGVGQGTLANTAQQMYLRGFNKPMEKIKSLAKQVKGRGFRYTNAIAQAYGIDPNLLLNISEASDRAGLEKQQKAFLRNNSSMTDAQIGNLEGSAIGKSVADLKADLRASKTAPVKLYDLMESLYTEKYREDLQNIGNLENEILSEIRKEKLMLKIAQGMDMLIRLGNFFTSDRRKLNEGDKKSTDKKIEKALENTDSNTVGNYQTFGSGVVKF